jgi:hypothetical protein
MASNVAPPRGRSGPSHSVVFAAGFANNTDLLAVSGKPVFAPQLVDFHNAGTAAENAVCTDQAGNTHTISVAPGQTYPFEIPVATLKTSGADISAVCFWWHSGMMPFNA